MEKVSPAKLCQMTISFPTYDIDHPIDFSYGKCCKPAKFINPEPKMGVKYVCGIHARSINSFYKRIGRNLQCESIENENL
jgi:hypothetical protein